MPGNLFGKGGDGGERERRGARETSEEQARIARELFGQTAGLRTGTLSTLEALLRGERPATMRVFAPEREAIESQFGRARENIISGTPARGGLMSRLLADVETERAQALGAQEAGVRREGFEQALRLGWGAPGTALSGLGSAAASFGGLFQSQAQLEAAEQGAKGEARGSAAMLGLVAYLGKPAAAGAAAIPFVCWVARAIYGDGTLQALLARRWIFERWRGPLACLVRCVYCLTGQRLAAAIRRWPAVSSLLRPWFDRAVRHAGVGAIQWA